MRRLLERFLLDLEERDSSAHTIDSYTYDIEKFIKWYKYTEGEEPEPDQVGPLDVAEFKRYLLNKKQKPGTINRAITTLSTFYTWAIDLKYADSNPAKKIKLIPEPAVAPRSLDRKQILAFIRAVQRSRNVRDVAIVTTMFHTGLRVSELCELQTDDVEIREKTGRLVVRKGKGGKHREIPLNNTSRAAIREWLEKRGDEPGYLFPGKKKGAKLTTRGVRYIIEKHAKSAGLENVSPHVLRHTFCKRLVDSGESIDRVALLAGHGNLDTTAKYTRATNKDLEKAVSKLNWE